jgi:phospholipid/cholesterol/gamma-HCH transport system substrate-binding protein
MTPRARLLTLAVSAVVLLGGCGLPTLSSLPAPNTVSGPTYRLTADFDDALNLPIGAKVKLNGAIIGQVVTIRTSDFVAHISLRIRKDEKLPVGTNAQIRFTTPLGELYIAVYPPKIPVRTYLRDGARISTAHTTAAPTIEDAFAALSALINGGGLDQVGVLVTELNKALHDNTSPVRDLIEHLDALVRNFNAHKDDFDHALSGLNELAAKLSAGDDVIDQALTVFPPAIRILSAETGQLNSLLDHVDELSQVTRNALHRGTGALLNDLRYSRPVLASLAGVRNQLAPTMEGLISFGKVLTSNAPGDFLNAAATVTLDFTSPAILPPSARTSPSASSAHDVIATLLGGGMR